MKETYDFSQGKRGAIDPVPSGKHELRSDWMITFLLGFESKSICLAVATIKH